MFDCYDTVHAVLQVTAGVMSTLKVRDLSHYLSFLKNKLAWSHEYNVFAGLNLNVAKVLAKIFISFTFCYTKKKLCKTFVTFSSEF